MLQASKLLPGGHGLAPVLLKRAATIELDWDVRQKSRFDATDSQGRHLGVFLPRGTIVRDGDVLIGEVSTVNDDETDNVFREPIGRFAEVEEDVAPTHLLVSDYRNWLM